MSTIHVPDAHPGRCLNHRTVWVRGYPQSFRCLDYEATEHVCSFEELPPDRRDLLGYDTVYTQSVPVPWVKPETTP